MKTFTRKSSLKRHALRDSCPIQKYKVVDGRYECKYCHKSYQNRSNVLRHMKEACKVIQVKKYYEELDRNGYKDESRVAKEIFVEKKYKIDNSRVVNNNNSNNTNSNNTNNTNNTNNIQINDNSRTNNIFITLNPFGQEDISHITQKTLNRLASKGYDAIPELIKLIHYNKNVPANHNLLIVTKCDGNNHVSAYDGEAWQPLNMSQLKDHAIEDKGKELLTRMDKIPEGRRGYQGAQNVLKSIEEDDDDVIIARIIEQANARKHLPKIMAKKCIQRDAEMMKKIKLND